MLVSVTIITSVSGDDEYNYCRDNTKRGDDINGSEDYVYENNLITRKKILD
jgi:hypothetical protein